MMEKLTKIGVQLYTIRDYLKDEENVKRSFDKLKKLGYDEAQTAGCAIPYETFGKLAKEAGLTIVGTHDNFDMMVNDPETAMHNHDLLDTKIMGIGGFFSQNPDDYTAFVAKANKVAENIGKQGFTFTYHNHSHEFIRIFGQKTAMEYLFEHLDQRVGFVLDTYWVQHGGADVRHWLEKLSGRVDILHLKDMARGGTAETVQYITEIGHGNLWWAGILETAFRSGVKHFVVEQDTCPGDPFESLKASSEYLHANFF
ncbi:MAG: sugar phosphate isomerase/epimerase [Clostridia bacterium]|nr:sugar phosphate isomerase/epimerase [Clostridia bacterium]